MNFEFATTGRIIFGNGTSRQAIEHVCSYGDSVFVLTGADPARAAWLIRELHEKNLTVRTEAVPTEPDIHLATRYIELARQESIDVVVALGGGSVIDTAKAVAALARNEGDILDYLEVIGKGKLLGAKPLPVIAIPTTAGTGSEVTNNAVFASPEHAVKVSLRHKWLSPVIAIVDPQLTLSMSPEVTTGCGLDAFTQLIEAYTTKYHNPLVDGLCREGISRAARSLRLAVLEGSNLSAREDMCVASLFSGLALANAKLGAVHGFAGPIGGLFPAPHGMTCARLLPFVTAVNIRALQNRLPGSPALIRYRQIAAILTGRHDADKNDLNDWFREFYKDLPVRLLCDYGITENDIPIIVEKAEKSSSMKGNPVELTRDEMTEILLNAL